MKKSFLDITGGALTTCVSAELVFPDVATLSQSVEKSGHFLQKRYQFMTKYHRTLLLK